LQYVFPCRVVAAGSKYLNLYCTESIGQIGSVIWALLAAGSGDRFKSGRD
jgi:hypothetical protein